MPLPYSRDHSKMRKSLPILRHREFAMVSAKLIRVGLVLTHGLAYCRGVLRGVKEFAETRPDWLLMPVPPESREICAVAKMKLSGVIAHVYTEELHRAVRALKKPWVNVAAVLAEPPSPRVGIDDRLVGALAAKHLLERGLSHFAFLGHGDHYYSVERERGFCEALATAGFSAAIFHEREGIRFDPVGRLWAFDSGIGRWLRELPKPLGVFAPNDIWGLHLTEVCRQISLRVPDDVAIIGVDNDDLLCDLARPALSSIAIPSEKIGYAAATMLARLLAGRRVSRRPLVFPPLGVVSRRSSDVLAIDDADVVAAARFIREHGHRALCVGDVLAAVPVSRRSLERRFRQHLGRSLLEEIRRAHVDRAKDLLAGSDLALHTIAQRAGFSDAKQFSIVFRQLTGTTPREFRHQIRSR
jgi:LacI family transcriptional regulator